eukprot:289046_1
MNMHIYENYNHSQPMASFSDDLQLTEGVNNLRNQFRQTFDCLEHFQLRLECQMEEGDYSSSINPIKLSQRIKSLQKILTNLQKRANILTKTKQMLIPNLINQLTEQCMKVHQLRCMSGLKTSGIPDNVISEFHDEVIKLNNNNNNNNQHMFEQNMNVNNNNNNNDNSDLTQDKFNKLPSSTKQRVTFEQLNESYLLIKKLYLNQNKKQRAPISIKILANKGVKLTGQTGTAIINCLRSLRLIKTSKQGIICI